MVICKFVFSLESHLVAAPFLFNAVKQSLIDLEPHYFLISWTSILQAINFEMEFRWDFIIGTVEENNTPSDPY